MKKLLFLLLLLIPLVTAATQEIGLTKGSSYLFQGKNITMIDFNDKDDNAIVCINNQKMIIGKTEKRIGDFRISIKKVTPNMATLEVNYKCEGQACICDYSCSNSLCIPPEEKPKTPEKTEEIQQDKCTNNADCNDNNPCTDDVCEGIPKQCNFIEIPDCGKTQEQNQITGSATTETGNLLNSLPIILIVVVLFLFIIWRIKVYNES